MRTEDTAPLDREADAAIARLLEAEAEAAAAVAECARRAGQAVRDAELRARRIESRADERLARLHDRLGARAGEQIAALHAEKLRLRTAAQLDASALERLGAATRRVLDELTGA